MPTNSLICRVHTAHQHRAAAPGGESCSRTGETPVPPIIGRPVAAEKKTMTTILSAVLGFVFAMILFYVTQWEKERMERISLTNLLKRELEYDLILIDKYIKDIEHDLNFLQWAYPIYTFTPRYDLFQNNFIDKAFKSGIIYALLSNAQINIISTILTVFSIDRKRSLIEIISKYKDKDIIYYDEDSVPITGKDYICMRLNDELTIIKMIQNDIKKILPFIKYERSELKEVVTQAICYIQKLLRRDD